MSNLYTTASQTNKLKDMMFLIGAILGLVIGFFLGLLDKDNEGDYY